MGLMTNLFGGKSANITAAMIRAEITRTETEIAAHRGALGNAMSSIATMTDAEHIKAEAEFAATKRAVARLEARLAHLNDELPKVITAADAAAKVAADEALRQRAQAAHKANTMESAKLLRRYDELGAQIADVLARLQQIAEETNIVNEALHKNPVAESVAHYSSHHRKHPDRPATERRELCPVWVYNDGTEMPATKDSAGNIKPADPVWDYRNQKPAQPRLEQRETVVERTTFRPGHSELPLSGIVLPPGFAGGAAHWPRRS